MIEIGPYLALILVGFLPNEIWRLLGVIVARGLNEDSEIVVWIRGVATATLAGVIAKIVVFPLGALTSISTLVRVGAVAIGFVAFLAIRRSIFAGVLTGEAALIAGALLGL